MTREELIALSSYLPGHVGFNPNLGGFCFEGRVIPDWMVEPLVRMAIEDALDAHCLWTVDKDRELFKVLEIGDKGKLTTIATGKDRTVALSHAVGRFVK